MFAQVLYVAIFLKPYVGIALLLLAIAGCGTKQKLENPKAPNSRGTKNNGCLSKTAFLFVSLNIIVVFLQFLVPSLVCHLIRMASIDHQLGLDPHHWWKGIIRWVFCCLQDGSGDFQMLCTVQCTMSKPASTS